MNNHTIITDMKRYQTIEEIIKELKPSDAVLQRWLHSYRGICVSKHNARASALRNVAMDDDKQCIKGLMLDERARFIKIGNLVVAIISLLLVIGFLAYSRTHYKVIPR